MFGVARLVSRLQCIDSDHKEEPIAQETKNRPGHGCQDH
jgi:hypothetical protein